MSTRENIRLIARAPYNATYIVLTFKVIKRVGSLQFYTYIIQCPILLKKYIIHSSYKCVFKFLIHHKSDLPSYFIDDGYATLLIRYCKMEIVWYFNILLSWSAIFKLLTDLL